MGKVDRLYNRVEPFAALFWALGIVLANPARWPGITPPPYTKHVLIWSGCLYSGGELVQFSANTRWPVATCLFLSSMLFIYECQVGDVVCGYVK